MDHPDFIRVNEFGGAILDYQDQLFNENVAPDEVIETYYVQCRINPGSWESRRPASKN